MEEEFKLLASQIKGRMTDNRFHGLLAEIEEAIAEEEDPKKLRRFGSTLKQLHNLARARAYAKDPRGGF